MSPTTTILSPDAPITAVQVYQQGATVTRTLRLTAPFPAAVVVAGLPLSLAPHTVRLRLLDLDGDLDADDLVVAGVHVGLHVRPRAEAPEAPAAAALREARQRLLAHTDLRSQLQLEINLLGQIQSPDRPRGETTQAPPMSPMVARVALEGFTHAAISGRVAELRALEVEIERARREVAALEDQRRRATDSDRVRPDELSHAAHLRLHVEGSPRAATLALEYFVPGVRWAPTYQCLIDRAAGQVTLQMRAAVVQHTGEDWSDVALRFSTAAPTLHSRLPTLTSIRIGKAQPPPPAGRGYRPPPQDSDALFADFDHARQRLLQLRQPHTPDLPSAPAVEQHHIPEDIARLEDRLGVRTQPPAPQPTDGFGGAPQAESAASAMFHAPPAPSAGPAPSRAKKMAAPRRMAELERERGISRDDMALEIEDHFASAEEEEADDNIRPRGGGRRLFAQLRLPGPAEGAPRGRLLTASAEDAYAQTLAGAGARAEFDVSAVIEESQDRAESVSLPGGLTPAESVQGRFDYAYTAENRLDVSGSGTVQVVPVLRWEGPCQVRYVLVPRVEPLAYRQAEIENPAPAPLLPGPVEVYVDGQYAVTAALPLVGVRGRLELGLGAEQAIRCARNAHFQERRSGEKVVAMTELLHDIEIELVNTLPRPARCEVRERIPQPASGAEVVVDEEDISPVWEAYTQKERHAPLEGGRRWYVTLDPGQTQRLHARYIVKIYANNELVGGNRREA